MHIENIHSIIEKLTECAKCELDKGIDGIDAKEMGEVTDMIKGLCEAEYYATITKAMEESEYGEDYDYKGRKHYRGQMRDSKGRYMRRGYEEPMMDYMPEMYRDMDLMDGKMYYTSQSMHDGSMSRDMREGRSGMSRKTYMETKEMHRGNTEEDKQAKKRELDKWMLDFSADVKELVGDMTAEEKTLLKTRLNNLQSSL